MSEACGGVSGFSSGLASGTASVSGFFSGWTEGLSVAVSGLGSGKGPVRGNLAPGSRASAARRTAIFRNSLTRRFPSLIERRVNAKGPVSLQLRNVLSTSVKLDCIIQHKLAEYIDNKTHVFYAAKRRRK